jgi:hypothetical protein
MKYILEIYFVGSYKKVESFESSSPFASISKGDILNTSGWESAFPMGEKLRVVEVQHGFVQGDNDATQIITLVTKFENEDLN